MATILVDYENVSTTDGLKGVEYLNEKDTLIIFYSQCCEKIRAEYIDMIEKSQCEFKTYKLVRSGKNALDFYLIKEKTRMLSIDAEQARITEYRAFIEKITRAFEGTEYEGQTEKIIQFIEGRDAKTPRLLYTGSMHEFGREDGRGIYQVLKKVV